MLENILKFANYFNFLRKNVNNDPEKGSSDIEEIAKSYRSGWAYAEVAFQYSAAIIFCTLIGYWLDNWLETDAIFTIGGVFFGATAGFILMLKTLKVLNIKKKKEDKKDADVH